MAHDIIIQREKREGGKTGSDRGVRGPVGCCQPDSYGSAPLILSDDLICPLRSYNTQTSHRCAEDRLDDDSGHGEVTMKLAS